MGELAGFPKEIINRMIFHQKAQGNKPNINIFKKNKDAGIHSGGFLWSRTKQYGEGIDFWSKIINGNNFSDFFELYPKQKQELPKVGDIIIPFNYDTENPAKQRIFIGYIENSQYPFLVITKEAYEDKLKYGKCADISAFQTYKYPEKEEEFIELTLEDISKGKGVGVNPSKIKIKKS